MIGYVEEGDPVTIVDQINSVVQAEPTLGQTHVLNPLGLTDASFLPPCHGMHGNGLCLLYFEINLQDT